MTTTELETRLEPRLEAENAALKKTAGRGLSLKVSTKGALSVYGLGRFPVTLYAGQWEKLLGSSDSIKNFIESNAGQLARKAAA